MGWAAIWDIVTRFNAARSRLGSRCAIPSECWCRWPRVRRSAHAAGLVVATGALNVSFSDSHDPYRQRLRRMLAASVLVGLAVMVGQACGSNYPLLVLVAHHGMGVRSGFAGGAEFVGGRSGRPESGHVGGLRGLTRARRSVPRCRDCSPSAVASFKRRSRWCSGRFAGMRRNSARWPSSIDALAHRLPVRRFEATEAPPASAETDECSAGACGFGRRPIHRERALSVPV